MALQVVFFSLFEFLDDTQDLTGQQEANISTMSHKVSQQIEMKVSINAVRERGKKSLRN